MTAPGRAAEKRELFDLLLQDGIASLHLDARRPGVIVPPHLRADEWLVLNYSYRFHLADFTFDDKAVRATLSFQRKAFYCTVPWHAVFAITNNDRSEGRLWREDMPASVRARLGVTEAPSEVDDGVPEAEPRGGIRRADLPHRTDAARRTAGSPRPARPAATAERAAPHSTPAAREPPRDAAARLGLRVLAGGRPDADGGEPHPAAPGPPAEAATPTLATQEPAPQAPPPPKPGGHLRRVK